MQQVILQSQYRLDIQNSEIVSVTGSSEDVDLSCVSSQIRNAERLSCGQRGYTSMVVDKWKL